TLGRPINHRHSELRQNKAKLLQEQTVSPEIPAQLGVERERSAQALAGKERDVTDLRQRVAEREQALESGQAQFNGREKELVEARSKHAELQPALAEQEDCLALESVRLLAALAAKRLDCQLALTKRDKGLHCPRAEPLPDNEIHGTAPTVPANDKISV